MTLPLLLFLGLWPAAQDGSLAPPTTWGGQSSAADSCPPDGRPIVSRLPQGGVRYCGRIDAEGVDAVRRSLRDGDSRLVITSVGGSLAAPLDLAGLVLDHGLDVEIAGPCFSGCASAVFIAGRQRIVSPTGVLGFHNTHTSSFMLGSRAFRGERAARFEMLQKRSAQELRLYAIKGVDILLLLEPQTEIETLCLKAAASGTSQSETVFNILSNFDLWSPTRELLLSRGVAVTGEYPQTLEDARNRLSRYLGSSFGQIKLVFGNGAPSSEIYRRFYRIGRC